MGETVLEKDVAIQFPHFTILKASAGSGKTYSLTERFVQFLLSGKIPQNHLRNILAITFSNNAAKEMKERILSWLQDIYFKDPEKIEALSQIVSLKEEHLAEKAGAKVDEILRNYSDFQVKTIDSFMASLYKASAIDLGDSPDFDIVMAPKNIITYAFNRFLRGVKEKSPEADFLEKLLGMILENRGGESAYLWDPSKDLLDEVVELHDRVSSIVKEAKVFDSENKMESAKKKIRDGVESLNRLVEKSGLTRRKGSSFDKILEIVRSNRFPDLIDKGLSNPPVAKPEGGGQWYEKISQAWDLLGHHIKEYIELHAMAYYNPYLKTYEAFKDVLDEVKKKEGKIFIQDINKNLSDYLDHEIVPDVYFRIGETIYHYLIDEFQDTSPMQWANLFPLIENSLSQGGSLFAVGDTKQAIYGFRHADYRIMKTLESKNPFSSALHRVKELQTNYRSLERIVDFSKLFFKNAIANHDQYLEPATRSGLIDYEQKVRESHEDSGNVEVIRIEKKDEEPAEKEKIQDLIKDLFLRGYSYSDIAILAYRNEDVVNITAWLNEIGVPFVSYSSLDIRRRNLTAEIVALITFLDSPPDDLSFAGFVLGDLFERALKRDGKAEFKEFHSFFFRNRRNSPLYKAFQEEFPEIWETYFEDLFKSAGYLPLYDLMNKVYGTYSVFTCFKEEEATLVKILEVIKNFEGEGRNNLGDFLRCVTDEEAGESDWTIDVPVGISAVKVMTIHKAKGLGFPVVILLLYEEMSRGFKYILNEQADGVNLLKINQQIMKASHFLKDIYEQEKSKSLVNRLNTLYVGFTRAEDELYILGVQGKRNQFPIDLLQKVGSQIGSRSGPRLCSDRSEQIDKTSPPEELKPYYPPDPVRISSVAVEELNLEERRRGEFIHQVLSFIDTLDENIGTDLEQIIDRLNDEWQTDYSFETMGKHLRGFLNHEEVRPYFQAVPGTVIKKEQDFSDSRGDLFRMDRVIFAEDRVSVIDYKTGTDKNAGREHVSQLKNYLRILQEVYPGKKIEGVIAYVDLNEVRKVK